ncbi:hypothetical protein COCMIDRAFT_88146 [Bipolaris oryzae ATCC 44560]|uniref:Uncharacterized protein n=1 Tax=Bipolaris oryzae ATCC 44560 TaxID=930090 RepID=W6ZWF2_COCMI|nr:uncharacterized protein COCMIDRAFT_88146 [Bipolaris oryzae ATCC 44560]EUC48151.1 hypothetical protein COCMIDRAFT_88146 [Bipolaris oryzae ATCC 44560]
MEQARVSSPIKSDRDSTVGSRRGSTSRSKQSGRSQQSAMTAQAQLEALDQKTARSEIESRSERNFFKMTGQIPPTPTTGHLNENDIYVRTEDLRSQCRATNTETEGDQDDATKSPKKKLFQNIRNPFSKSSSSIAPPPMPSKAAQVLGTAARQPRVVQVRPIKPAVPIQPRPAKPSRSETVKSLPTKVVNPDSYAHRHLYGPLRCSPTTGNASPDRHGFKMQSSDAENNSPTSAFVASPNSIIPPTPPAKDTPPTQRPASPLRRVAPAQDLRQSYDQKGEKSMQLHLPNFDFQEASLLPRPDHSSENHQSNICKQNSYSPLKPRFYSPKYIPARGFLEGETPSKNTDASRFVYSLPSEFKSQPHLRKVSTSGSIRMVFQGDPRDIDPNSPTARELYQNQQRARAEGIQPDTGITTRVMQELRINERCNPTPHNNGQGGPPHPDQSSSRLTDMLDAVGPGRSESHGDFRPHCPSAVPSPLHKAPVLVPTARPSVPPNVNFGPFPPPLSPKSIDDHFYMTNEHLDVVGKTTWDLLEMFSKQHKSTSKERHDELVALTNKHYDDIKSRLNKLEEHVIRIHEYMSRFDSITTNHDNVYATLDLLKNNINEGIPDTLTNQGKKMASMESEIKELKQMLQAMQKSSEEKTSQPYVVSGQISTPNKSYPQSQGFAGNHGPVSDMGNVVDNRSMISPLDIANDGRVGYQGGQWAARAGYLGRNSKEDRPSYPTNPYHFASGGHFNAGYSGSSYSPFGYSPSSSDQQYPFNNHGQAK